MPIYFIRALSSGNIKIGHAANPILRLMSLQSSSSEDLQLLRIIEGGPNYEKFLHHICKSDNVRSEWYRPTKRVLKIVRGGREIPLSNFQKHLPDTSTIDVVKFRKQLGLTQDKFAELVGVNQGTVSKWEHGKPISRFARVALNRIKLKAT